MGVRSVIVLAPHSDTVAIRPEGQAMVGRVIGIGAITDRAAVGIIHCRPGKDDPTMAQHFQ